ncbi:efflux RND transporter periplasmic adaptor subunit [Segetibacter sp.]|jgi:RND family efflux transporter MFP subunit|uniref:efflux RND transporter periplasmic adaptor subunit n=1 Tax=Segetibacter sp. TaxID=2231182 RepID=UPI00260B3B34|nr:efflux RND transporter periplasmic adaptor subunit [Segetibacter sp.]MCW3078679.1 Secretion protein HylD [Segetibacter sp.]
MKMRWHIAILLAVMATGCALEEKKETVEVAEVPVIELAAADTSLHKNYVADIHAEKNVEIRARVNGFLEQIYIDEGRPVKKGQLLFRISNKEFINDLNKARANVASARAAARITELEMERVRVLVDKKVIVKSELDLAMARVADAKAKVAEALTTVDDAQTKIGYLSVRSPFAGVIDRIPLKMGSLLDDGTLLTTVSDISHVYAYFHVSENEFLQHQKSSTDNLQENEEAKLVLSDGSTYPHVGKIETQEAQFSDNTGSIAFRVKFGNPKNVLKHGASGNIQLVTELDDRILVPQKSVLEIQDKSFVFVVGQDNTVKMQSFTAQLRISDYYVVKDGLKPGDKIVYEGVQNIRDGAQIKPRLQTIGSIVAAK